MSIIRLAKMKYYVLLFFPLLFSSEAHSQMSLQTALPCDGTTMQMTPEDILAGQSLIQVASGQNIEMVGNCLGWTNTGQGNVWYAALKDATVFAVDSTQNRYLGSWSIGEANSCENNPSCTHQWWHGRWSADELLTDRVIGEFPDNMGWTELSYEVSHVDFMGCMQRSPLRYGDIDGDGTNELIMLLSNLYSIDWVVFSTQMNRTIFTSKLNLNDVVLNSVLDSGLVSPIPVDQRYQYWSRWGAEESLTSSLAQGVRSFAKLYFDDFDGDNNFDILVWRKVYESRLVNDATSGFELREEVFGHYELVEGEYLLQTTDAPTIEGWLSQRQLTWAAGYPNQSECPGEEGHLIPEMHSPLLNDPEVLPSTPAP
ncbi:MAG: hypothetical protein K6L80_03370 [Agarilytica sp.]